VKLAVHLLRLPYGEEAMSHLLARLSPEIELTTGPELPDPAGYQVLIAGRPCREHLVASPRLRALIVPWAGIPPETRELMAEFPGITVHNLHHNAQPVAEVALTLLLAAAKFVVPLDRSMRAGDWTPRYEASPSILLQGKTALILGYGAIGRRLAGLCRGIGMETIATRRHASTTLQRDAEGTLIAPAAALHDLLPRADALLVCLPHTSETNGLIGAAELALLLPHAILVNVARGPIVDEGALYQALRSGSLYAAGLDVWYNYPTDDEGRPNTPPSQYPFHELDNLVMSPHRGAASTETERLRVEHLADLLNAAARGEPMPNRMDLEAGY
jgi:phosphoglycerate dehydrogenase-like enzyme